MVRRTLLDGWYQPFPSPDDLAGILACSWEAMPTGEHRLTPDGCCDIVCLSTGMSMLCGPERRSWTFSLPPGITAVGVRFLPGAVHGVFGIDVATIADRVVPLADVLGSNLSADLDRRLMSETDDTDRRASLLATVRSATGTSPRNDPLAEEILSALLRTPGISTASLARLAGLTTRQLHRRSLRVFGYGTSVLARLLRLQRFLGLVAADHNSTLARLALDAGYVDQAHLSRECRTITGLSPTELIAEYFPTFPDMSDPYKTTVPLAATLE